MTTLHTNEHDLTASVIEELSLDDLEELLNMSSPAPKEPVAEPVESVEEEIDMAELINDDVLDLDGFGTDIDEELMSLDTIEVSDDDLLAAIVNDIEVKEAKAAAYEEQPAEEATSAAPSMSERLEKALAAKKEMTATDARAPKEPKEKKEPRKTTFTHDRAALAEDRGGADFYLIEKTDLELDDAAKQARHDEVVESIKKMNVKVGAKCLNLLAAANGKAELSIFMKLAIKYVLENEIVKQADLVEYFVNADRNGHKAYNKSTALPQAANCVKVFSDLSIIKSSSTGFVANPDSLLLEKAKALVV